MSVVAAAIIGSAAVGYIASENSNDAHQEANEASIEASTSNTNATIALQKELAEISRNDLSDWRESGAAANDMIMKGINDGSFEVGKLDVPQDPGYQFRLDQGQDAIEASAASRGRLLSGSQLKAATEYSQNYASNEYDKAYARESNNINRKFNILNSVSQQGQNAAAGQAGVTQNLSNASTHTMNTNTQNQIQANHASANANASSYGNNAQIANQAVQNWMTYQGIKNPAA